MCFLWWVRLVLGVVGVTLFYSTVCKVWNVQLYINHFVLLRKQLKKKLSRMGKMRLQGWRGSGVAMEDAERTARSASQIGQLLHYLLAIQLRRIQLHCTNSNDDSCPSPVLGVFIERGKVCGFYRPLGTMLQYSVICSLYS